MFNSIKAFIISLFTTATIVVEGIEENAHSFKEISAKGHIMATNSRIKTEIQAKIDQSIHFAKLADTMQDNKHISSELQAQLVSLSAKTDADSTSGIDDIINSNS